VAQVTENWQSPPAEPHKRGRHKYNGMPPSVLIGLLRPSNHHPTRCCPRHNTSHFGWGGPLPLLAPYMHYPLHDEDARGWFLEGKFIVRMRFHSFTNKYRVFLHLLENEHLTWWPLGSTYSQTLCTIENLNFLKIYAWKRISSCVVTEKQFFSRSSQRLGTEKQLHSCYY
jgi:hypothetical protein